MFTFKHLWALINGGLTILHGRPVIQHTEFILPGVLAPDGPLTRYCASSSRGQKVTGHNISILSPAATRLYKQFLVQFGYRDIQNAMHRILRVPRPTPGKDHGPDVVGLTSKVRGRASKPGVEIHLASKRTCHLRQVLPLSTPLSINKK